jgi:hypothetical protein
VSGLGSEAEALAFAHLMWPPEVVADEAAYSQATRRLSSAVYECYTFDHFESAWFLWQVLNAGAGFALAEPQRSVLDHHRAGTADLLANWRLCQHDYAAVPPLLEQGWQLLDGRDARRAALGLEPRPSTAVRLTLLRTLADLKWRRADDAWRDLILTPAGQVAAWLRYYARVTSWLEQEAGSGDIRRNESEDLLGAGLFVAVGALRDAPELLGEVIAPFNAWHSRVLGGPGLAVVPGRWRDSAAHVPATPWYWQYEICALWLAERQRSPVADAVSSRAREELEGLYTRLLRIVRGWHWARENFQHQSSILRDRAWMRAELGG